MALRANRTKFTEEDKILLAIYFEANPHLTPQILDEICERIHLPPKSVRTWFRNERRKRSDKVMKFKMNTELYKTRIRPINSEEKNKNEILDTPIGDQESLSSNLEETSENSQIFWHFCPFRNQYGYLIPQPFPAVNHCLQNALYAPQPRFLGFGASPNFY